MYQTPIAEQATASLKNNNHSVTGVLTVYVDLTSNVQEGMKTIESARSLGRALKLNKHELDPAISVKPAPATAQKHAHNMSYLHLRAAKNDAKLSIVVKKRTEAGVFLETEMYS